MTITIEPPTATFDPCGSDEVPEVQREEAPAPVFVVPDLFQAGSRNKFIDVTLTSFMQVLGSMGRKEGCLIEYELNGNRIRIIVTGLRLVAPDGENGRVDVAFEGVEETTRNIYEIIYRGRHPFQLRLIKRAQHAEPVQEQEVAAEVAA